VLTNHIVEKLIALLLLTNHIVAKLIAPLYTGLQYVLYSEIQYDCTRRMTYDKRLIATVRRTPAYNMYSVRLYQVLRIKLIASKKVDFLLLVQYKYHIRDKMWTVGKSMFAYFILYSM
jgi:hypothetical protein